MLLTNWNWNTKKSGKKYIRSRQENRNNRPKQKSKRKLKYNITYSVVLTLVLVQTSSLPNTFRPLRTTTLRPSLSRKRIT